MAHRFELRFPDGEAAGSIETNEGNWQPGDTVIAHGNRWYRITAVIPGGRISEFVDGQTGRITDRDWMTKPLAARNAAARRSASDRATRYCVGKATGGWRTPRIPLVRYC